MATRVDGWTVYDGTAHSDAAVRVEIGAEVMVVGDPWHGSQTVPMSVLRELLARNGWTPPGEVAPTRGSIPVASSGPVVPRLMRLSTGQRFEVGEIIEARGTDGEVVRFRITERRGDGPYRYEGVEVRADDEVP